MRLRFRRSVRWSEWKECTFCCTWWEYRKHRRGPRNGTFARLLCMWVGTAVQSQTCDWQNSSPSPWCARRFSSTPRSGLITTGLRKKSPILRASFLCLAGRKSNGKTAALHCRIANEGKTCRFWYRYIPVGHFLPEMKKEKKKCRQPFILESKQTLSSPANPPAIHGVEPQLLADTGDVQNRQREPGMPYCSRMSAQGASSAANGSLLSEAGARQ